DSEQPRPVRTRPAGHSGGCPWGVAKMRIEALPSGPGITSTLNCPVLGSRLMEILAELNCVSVGRKLLWERSARYIGQSSARIATRIRLQANRAWQSLILRWNTANRL